MVCARLLLVVVLAAALAQEATVAAAGYTSQDSGSSDGGGDGDSGGRGEPEEWTSWGSQWSACSRSCGGGVARQRRLCLRFNGCRGEAVRYRLCNLTPCPADLPDFRSQQCSEYNNIPYEGRLYTWLPSEWSSDKDGGGPSSDIIQRSPPHGDYQNNDDTSFIDDNSSPESYPSLDEIDDESTRFGTTKLTEVKGPHGSCTLVCRRKENTHEFSVVLVERVHDGTSCTAGKLDMCINGICQRVGCDLKLDSALVLDGCGVCGGNGSTCTPSTSSSSTSTTSTTSTTTSTTTTTTSAPSTDQPALPAYQWQLRPSGPCSTSCGGGFQMVTGMCMTNDDVKVTNHFCDRATRPVPNIITCGIARCPTRWHTQEWGNCSAQCGKGGYQLREVYCLEPAPADEGSDEDTRVADHYCAGKQRPPHRTACNTHDCPRWYDGIWSQCSVSCGTGLQSRAVHCRDDSGWSSPHCPASLKPSTTRPCRKGVLCPPPIPASNLLAANYHRQTQALWWDAEDDGADEAQRLEAEEEAEPPSGGYGLGGFLPMPQALTHDQPVPSEPTYIMGDWEECSVSCGEGTAKRKVACKIFLEFSRTVASLPDEECHGDAPARTRRCSRPPCPHALVRSDEPSDSANPASDAAADPLASLEETLMSIDNLNKDYDTLPHIDTNQHHFHDDKQNNQHQHYKPYQPHHQYQHHRKQHHHETPHHPITYQPYYQLHREKDKDSLRVLEHAQPHAQFFKKNDGRQQQQQQPTLHSDESSHMNYGGYDHYASYHGYDIALTDDAAPGDKDGLGGFEVAFGGREAAGHDGVAYTVGGYNPTTPRRDPHHWRSGGFGPCSATCLGGVQELLVQCVRVDDNAVVAAQLCPLQQRPDVITRTCNDQPCPRRWRLGRYANCTKLCGGGIKTRTVDCIHEITRGGANTVVVPSHLCPHPRPDHQISCNAVPCNAEWVPQPWSKCSIPCGGGTKTRGLHCRQVLGDGRVVDQTAGVCPRRRLNIQRRCNKRKCPSWNRSAGATGTYRRRRPAIRSQANQNYLQKKYMKKVKLKVGGQATVFRGVMVKVKCPVRHFDRSHITWWKDGRRLGFSSSSSNPITSHIHVTRKGAIKINRIHYSDEGVYICKAGTSEGNLTIHVKPLPSSFSTAAMDRRGSGGGSQLSHIRSNEISPPRRRPNYDHRSENEVHAPSRTSHYTPHHGWALKPEANVVSTDLPLTTRRHSKAKQRYHFNSIRPILPYPTSPNRYTSTSPALRHTTPPPSPSYSVSEYPDLQSSTVITSSPSHDIAPNTSPSQGATSLGEGPFKASSKNMHTFEETSDENQHTQLNIDHLAHHNEPDENNRTETYSQNSLNSNNIFGRHNSSNYNDSLSEDRGSRGRKNKAREYIYSTYTKTHTTSGTPSPSRGISLLTERIVQSRLNARGGYEFGGGGRDSGWRGWSAGKDVFDERTLVGNTDWTGEQMYAGNSDWMPVYTMGINDGWSTERTPANNTGRSLEHVYGTINNLSTTHRVSDEENHVYGSFSHKPPPLSLVSEEDHEHTLIRPNTKTNIIDFVKNHLDNIDESLNSIDYEWTFGTKTPHHQIEIKTVANDDLFGQDTRQHHYRDSFSLHEGDNTDNSITGGSGNRGSRRGNNDHFSGNNDINSKGNNNSSNRGTNDINRDNHEDNIMNHHGSISHSGAGSHPPGSVEHERQEGAGSGGGGSRHPTLLGDTSNTVRSNFLAHITRSYLDEEQYGEERGKDGLDHKEVPEDKQDRKEAEATAAENEESFGSSRGGRHAVGPGDPERISDARNYALFGTPEVLGKGTRDSLEFEWKITNWSNCSHSCGYAGSPGGYQVRSTQCMVRVGNVSKSVDAQLCVEAGLTTPPTIQDCGLQECPQWRVDEWSICRTARCFTLHYAYQRRKVTCETHTGAVTTSNKCDKVTKPRQRRECYNIKCIGVWRTEDWSQCMAPCGGQGYRTRLLQCVWNGSRRAAGNACRDQQRPEVVRWCDSAPCPPDHTSTWLSAFSKRANLTQQP